MGWRIRDDVIVLLDKRVCDDNKTPHGCPGLWITGSGMGVYKSAVPDNVGELPGVLFEFNISIECLLFKDQTGIPTSGGLLPSM
jgi:hypothetical protein